MKSIGMLLEEVKIELVDYINETCKKKGLSAYLIEIPFKEVYEELVRVKQQEVKQEQEQWLQDNPPNLDGMVLEEKESNDIIKEESDNNAEN